MTVFPMSLAESETRETVANESESAQRKGAIKRKADIKNRGFILIGDFIFTFLFFNNEGSIVV